MFGCSELESIDCNFNNSAELRSEFFSNIVGFLMQVFSNQIVQNIAFDHPASEIMHLGLGHDKAVSFEWEKKIPDFSTTL